MLSAYAIHIQLVTKPYTYGFSCSRLHVRLHSVVLSILVIKLLRLINLTWTLHAWRPCEVKWLFSRTICTMTLLRDFFSQTHTQPCCFNPLGVYTNPPPLSHPFCSHWTNLPRKLLEVTSQIVWHVQCTLKHLELHESYADIGGWADTKSC